MYQYNLLGRKNEDIIKTKIGEAFNTENIRLQKKSLFKIGIQRSQSRGFSDGGIFF